MELQLLINNVDFSNYIIQPGNSPIDAGMSWEVVQDCIRDDSFSFYLDFNTGTPPKPGEEVPGRPHINPEIFRMGEVVLEAKNVTETPMVSGEIPGPIDVASDRRRIRLFGGIITSVSTRLVPDNRNYPVIHCRAMGYGWRLRKTIMYAQPDSMQWLYESDVNCILHPSQRYENGGIKGWSEIAGFAPPLLSWYHWRPIRSLASPGEIDSLREGGPGSLMMIYRNTTYGLSKGWCAVGKPNDLATAGTVPYLEGTLLGVGNPSMQSASNILDALAARSGARHWVSTYGELNYVRPGDLPEINITEDNTYLRGIGRDIDFTTLSTITAMLNMNTWGRNEEKIEIHNENDVASQIIGVNEFFNRLPIISTPPNGGNPIGRVIRIQNATDPSTPVNAGVVNITEGTYDIVSPVTSGTLTDIKFDSNTQTLQAPAHGAFSPDEVVVFEPETMLVWGESYQTVPLVHDRNIRVGNGLFIEPVYMEDASTPWDAFNTIAKVLARGADIDKISFYDISREITVGTESYNRDEILSRLRGRPVKFDSRFLNIRGGRSLEISRASTTRLQAFKNELEGPSIPTVDLRYSTDPIRDKPYPDGFSYILRSVYSPMDKSVNIGPEEPRRELGPGLTEPAWIDFGRYSPRFREAGEPKEIQPIRYIIPFEELLSRLYQVKIHMEAIRDSFLVNGITGPDGVVERRHTFIDEELGRVIGEINDAWSGDLKQGIAPYGLQIWHNLDGQAYSEFDSSSRGSNYFARYGNEFDPEGYYCRTLTITPLGPTIQRYQVELYRYPPIIMDKDENSGFGINWAIKNFQDLRSGYEMRFGGSDTDEEIETPQRTEIPVTEPYPVNSPAQPVFTGHGHARRPTQ